MLMLRVMLMLWPQVVIPGVMHIGERIVFWPLNTNTNIFDDKDIPIYSNTFEADNDDDDDNSKEVEEKENVSIGKPHSNIFGPNYSNIFEYQIICSPLVIHVETLAHWHWFPSIDDNDWQLCELVKIQICIYLEISFYQYFIFSAPWKSAQLF